MHIADPVHFRTWRAELALDYERRGARTVLAARRHDGPLVVQKALYPEGDGVCHSIIVHPPAGIAGGDELEITARADAGSHALLTTPGAAKWYRSAGPWARQRIAFTVENSACLEWLPQETIVFNGALARSSIDVQLRGDAAYIGWEILCLGRNASSERFMSGEFQPRTKLTRNGAMLWVERGRIGGRSALLDSPAGLAGCTVCGTLLATAPDVNVELRAACREELPANGRAAITLMPGVLIARYLGDSSETAKNYFTRLWQKIRPALMARDAVLPRIWST